MPKRRKSLPHPLTEEEAKKLLAATSSRSITALRDQVVIILMLRAGLRVSEVCNLAPADLDLPKTLRVHRGKGAKDRVLYLAPHVADRLAVWLARRPNGSRWLLPVIHGGHRALGVATPGGRMSPRSVAAHLSRLAQQAGIERKVSPHKLRHTYATSELRRGVLITHVQRDLGHGDLSTTAIYLHVVDSEREASANGRPPVALP